MANAGAAIQMNGVGADGRRFHLPAGGTIYEGTMVAQLVATGLLVAATTAGAGPVIGKATHNAVSGERCLIETDRVYALTNGTTAFSDADLVGSPAYAVDDNSVSSNDNSGARLRCGTFMGMEADGKVRVRLSAENRTAVDGGSGQVQTGSGTFAAGVLAVNSGITVTAASRIFATRVTAAGTSGDEIRVPAADRTVGGPGTGALTFRSYLSAVAATSDTSTFEYMIVG